MPTANAVTWLLGMLNGVDCCRHLRINAWQMQWGCYLRAVLGNLGLLFLFE